MKKMIKRLLAVLLLVCMLASFTGCGYALMYGAVVVSCILPDRAKTYEGADRTACKTIFMIGCDDAAHRIAYCLMVDRDLDYIGEPDEDPAAAMQQHMDLWFYWIS